MRARLVCRLRPGQTEKFAVPASPCVIGREPGLDVTVPVDGVSRRHAKITLEGRSYWIENLSAAGTFVNGILVARERLAHLDVITLGKKIDLLFLLRAADGPASVATEGIVRAALVPEGADEAPFEITPGEVLVGRSTSNNLVLEESGAVSKVHARIERSPAQLVLRDLGSSNGTFVNGARTMTALLRDGDVISFASVVNYRVILQRGEMPAAIAAAAVPGPPTAQAPERALFSPEWKTRYDWDSAEIKGIAALQARLIAEDAERKRAREKKEAAAKPATKPATKPAARPDPKPSKPATFEKTGAVPVVPPAPPGDASPARAAVDALAAQGVPPPAPPPPAPAPPSTLEVRLTGGPADLVATGPGTYTLGRASDASLRVNSPSVSRRHALLVIDEAGGAWVEDNGGANGTRLNGAAVVARTRLADGDRLAMGEVELVVRLAPRAT
jgi:pSer/pThr/pTyr-binding forkhead associated (FHA) protein